MYDMAAMILAKLESNFIETTFRHGCSLANLLHIFRTPFPKNPSGWLLLEIQNIDGLELSGKKFMFHWRKISLFQFHLYFSASSAFEIYKLCQKNLIKVKRSMKDQAKKSLGK